MIKLSEVFRKYGAVQALLLVLLGFSGCASGPSGNSAAIAAEAAPAGGNENVPPPVTEYLNVGDTLNIVYNDLPIIVPPFTGQIKSDGTVTLILNQQFQAAGKTRSQLEQEIRERYVPSYFKNMTVTITQSDASRLIYIGGEVRQPGPRVYLPGITVWKTIQSAGDFTEFANKKKVKVTRASTRKTLTVNILKVRNNPSLDVEVYPGDIIHVPRRLF